MYIIASGRVHTNCYMLVDGNNNCVIVDLPDETGEKEAKASSTFKLDIVFLQFCGIPIVGILTKREI